MDVLSFPVGQAVLHYFWMCTFSGIVLMGSNFVPMDRLESGRL